MLWLLVVVAVHHVAALSPRFDDTLLPHRVWNYTGVTFFAAEDIEGDGDHDLLVTAAHVSTGGFVGYHVNTGGGNFAAAVPLLETATVANSPRQVFLADIAGNGAQDIVVVRSEEVLTFLRNTLVPEDELEFFSNARRSSFDLGDCHRASASDIDQDGNIDIVTASDAVRFFPSDGSGTADVVSEVADAGSALFSIHAVQLNPRFDNNFDLVLSSATDNAVYQVMGQGVQRLTTGTTVTWGPLLFARIVSGPVLDVAVADIDEDGQLDAVFVYTVAGTSTGFVDVLFTDIFGGFGRPVTVSASNTIEGVRAVAAGDVEGSGRGLDVVAVYNRASSDPCDHGVVWWPNTGGVSFGSMQVVAMCVVTRPLSVTLADIDGDLDLDVLVGAVNGAFVFRNRLDPLDCDNDHFPLAIFGTDNSTCTPCTSDCPRLTYDSSNGTVCENTVDKCTSCSSLCNTTQYPVGCDLLAPGNCTACSDINFGDVCGDGEFLYGCGTSLAQCQACADAPTCPSGTYQTQACTPTAQQVCTPCASVCPSGQFPQGCSGTTPGVCVACDALPASTGGVNICRDNEWLEACGTLDATCTGCHTPCSPGKFMTADCLTARNTVCEAVVGDAPTTLTDLQGARAVRLSDVDGDGHMDVIAAGGFTSDDSKLVWFRGSGDIASFSGPITISEALYEPRDVLPVDLDGDDDIDLVAASYQDNIVSWWRNVDRRGTFSFQVTIANNLLGPSCLDAGDLNGDGFNDLVVGSYLDDSVSLLMNSGTGEMSSPRRLTILDNGVMDVKVYDVNADSMLDIVSVSWDGAEVSVLWNVGFTASFTREVLATDSPQSAAVAIGDLDSDGALDFVVSSLMQVAVYSLMGGTLSPRAVIGNDVDGAYGISLADVDGDGDVDVVTSTYAGDSALVYHNDGAGGFQHPYPDRREARPNAGTRNAGGVRAAVAAVGVLDAVYSVAVGDLDHDGDIDLVATSRSAVIALSNNHCVKPDLDCGANPLAAPDVPPTCRRPDAVVAVAATCTTCDACPSGSFRVDCGTSASRCVACLDANKCLPALELATACSATSNTVCEPVCETDTFYAADAGGCQACMTPCPAGFFETPQCLPTSDKCLSCTTRCGDGLHAIDCIPEEEQLGLCVTCSAVPSSTSAGCAADEFLEACGTPAAQCVACTPPCKTNESYVEVAPCTATGNRVCVLIVEEPSEFPVMTVVGAAGGVVVALFLCWAIPKCVACQTRRKKRRLLAGQEPGDSAGVVAT